MNTYDVRNMNVKQWVFWATALPLTVLIVTLCLVWAGELNNFWSGFRKLWKNEKKGSYVIVEEYLDRRRSDGREEVVVIEERERERYGLPPPPPRMGRSHNAIYGRESYV